MTRHSIIRSWLVKTLRESGAEVLALHGHSMQAPGWPDLRISHEMFCGWVEIKYGEDRPSPIQCRRAMSLQKTGDSVAFAWQPNIEDTIVLMLADDLEISRWRAVYHTKLKVEHSSGMEILDALHKFANITKCGQSTVLNTDVDLT